MASNTSGLDPKGLGATFDAHCDAEFNTRDIEATMASMGDAPHLTHVPTMTGGNGRNDVRRFYETWFIGHWPKDVSITRLSRTVDETRVVDEMIVSFTHDCEMPALLPGVPPTGRKVVLPHVAVVGFKDGKIAYRAYLLGPGVLARADRTVGSVEAAGDRRRASGPPARSEPSLQYADPQELNSVQAFGFFCREARFFGGFAARRRDLCSTCRDDWGAGARLRFLKKVHQP